MLANNVIEESKSELSSPVVIVGREMEQYGYVLTTES